MTQLSTSYDSTVDTRLTGATGQTIDDSLTAMEISGSFQASAFGDASAEQNSGIAGLNSGLRRFPRAPRRRMLSKQRGFLDQVEGKTARVGIVDDNGDVSLADMSADLLRKAGVKERNQPFELLEFEFIDEPGSIGYQVLPMAAPFDTEVEQLELSAEDRANRNAALEYFGRGPEN